MKSQCCVQHAYQMKREASCWALSTRVKDLFISSGHCQNQRIAEAQWWVSNVAFPDLPLQSMTLPNARFTKFAMYKETHLKEANY